MKNYFFYNFSWKEFGLFTLVFVVFQSLLFQVLHTDVHYINGDVVSTVYGILRGEDLNGRYPPFFILWCLARLKTSELFGSSYFLMSLCMQFPVFLFTFYQIKKTSTYFFESKKLQALSAWCFFTYPLYFIGIHMDVNEILYVLFFVLSIRHLFECFFSKADTKEQVYAILFSGFYSGLAALVRPNPMLFFIFLFFGLFIYRKHLSVHMFRYLTLGLLYTGIFFITIAPWTYYVSTRNNHFILLSTGFLPSHKDGFKRFPPKLTEETVYPHMPSVSKAMEFHIKLLKTDPVFTVKVWLQKVFLCWYGSESNKWELPFFVINFIYIAFAVWGWRVLKPPQKIDKKILGLLLALIIGYNWALTVIVVSMARYMVPLFPIICILASQGLYSIYKSTLGKE